MSWHGARIHGALADPCQMPNIVEKPSQVPEQRSQAMLPGRMMWCGFLRDMCDSFPNSVMLPHQPVTAYKKRGVAGRRLQKGHPLLSSDTFWIATLVLYSACLMPAWNPILFPTLIRYPGRFLSKSPMPVRWRRSPTPQARFAITFSGTATATEPPTPFASPCSLSSIRLRAKDHRAARGSVSWTGGSIFRPRPRRQAPQRMKSTAWRRRSHTRTWRWWFWERSPRPLPILFCRCIFRQSLRSRASNVITCCFQLCLFVHVFVYQGRILDDQKV